MNKIMWAENMFWFARFCPDKELVKDESRSGRPSISKSTENIERLRVLLAKNRRLTLRLIEERLIVSKDKVGT